MEDILSVVVWKYKEMRFVYKKFRPFFFFKLENGCRLFIKLEGLYRLKRHAISCYAKTACSFELNTPLHKN